MASFMLIPCAALPAAPPPLDIPEAAITGGLLATHLSQIDARLDYWINQIVGADKQEPAVDARRGLINDYRRYSAAEYQFAFAAQAAKKIAAAMDALAKADELRPLKEVNLAMAASEMAQASIQPALDRMTAHPNAAVRFLGWEGYRRARLGIVRQPDGLKAMADAIRRSAAGEDSALVLSAMFGAMTIAPQADQDLRKVQESLFDVFKEVWTTVCGRVMGGSVTLAGAASEGVAAAANFAGVFKDDTDRLNASVQLIVDIMWCSSKAYDSARAMGEVAQVNDALLRHCEAAINAICKKQGSFISAPLTAPNVPDRGAAVGLGVFSWIDELNGFGVKKPDIAPIVKPAEAPAATTAPAASTAPAETKPAAG